MSTNIKGIDVSKWQGTIDWAKVAGDGVKFAMIRLGYGSKDGTACGVDSYYQKNVENALANGIAVGCYFYSYALSTEAVKKEAAFVIQQLAKYKGRILYPIAFDIEDSTQAGLGKATLTDMVTAFCSALEAAGYYASFYCNADWARNRLDMTALARFDFWLAQWASAPTYTGHTYNMWQSSSKGSVAGISGNVDMDTAFVDYEATIKGKKLNGYTGSSTSSGSQKGDNNMTDRENLVKTAASFIGCKESDGSHRQIIDIYNAHKPLARGYAVKYTDAWCATFVSAMAIKCGLTDIIPTECGCGQMITLFKNLGEWQENDAYTPQPGDVIFYDWDDSGSGDNAGNPDHVGIVETISGSSFKVIEGNMSNAVGRRTMAVNGRYIRGYGVPKYKNDTSSSNSTGTSSGSASLSFKVGDEVQFTGTSHYTSANATSAKSCKAGKAKVTAVSPSGKHPYHLIAVSGSGSTVYGWVDADKVQAIATASTTGALKVGDVVQFTGTKHYTSAAATTGSATKPGPAKITAISPGAKHPYHVIHTDGTSTVYGWVDAADIGAAASSEIAVGDVVQFAGGPHYTSANATSYKTSPKAGPAKVTAISKGAKHPYHIVHTTSASSVYGWVDADKVSK